MKCRKCQSRKIVSSKKTGEDKAKWYNLFRKVYYCSKCEERFWIVINPVESKKSKIVLALIALVLALFFILPHTLFKNINSPESKKNSINKFISKPIKKPEKKMFIDEKKLQSKSPDKKIDEKPDGKPYGKTGGKTDDKAKYSETAKAEEVTAELKKTPGTSQKITTIKPGEKADPLIESQPLKTNLKRESIKVQVQKNTPYLSLMSINTKKMGDLLTIIISCDSQIPETESFFLDSPPRFVVDIKGKWKNSGPSYLSVKDNLVSKIRIGTHKDRLRIVMDIKNKENLAPELKRSKDKLIITLIKK
jgi:hypothetical protein